MSGNCWDDDRLYFVYILFLTTKHEDREILGVFWSSDRLACYKELYEEKGPKLLSDQFFEIEKHEVVYHDTPLVNTYKVEKKDLVHFNSFKVNL